MVVCSICERRMQGNQLRGNLHYRCVMKRDYPAADHLRSLSVREDHLLRAIDQWLGSLFGDDQLRGRSARERMQLTPGPSPSVSASNERPAWRTSDAKRHPRTRRKA